LNQAGRRVAIVGGSRIPFCRANTSYAEVGNQEMMTAAVDSLIDRFGLYGRQLGEVAIGAVIKHSADWNLAREVVLGAELSPKTPGVTLQRACATSLDATILIANKIAMGQIDCGIAGGADTTSDVPIVYGNRLARRLLATRRARTMAARLKAWKGFRPRELKPWFPQVAEPRTGLSMGEHTEQMVDMWNVTRLAQDELALASHQNAAKAYQDGFYDDIVTEFHGVSQDNNIRSDTSLEKLTQLLPVFDKSMHGSLTAGNSSPLTDGASCVLLASEQWAQENNLPVQAYFGDSRSAAVDFIGGREGLLMAPATAVSNLLSSLQMNLQDFDFYEIHEAFAVQVLSTLKAWENEAYCKDVLGRDQPMGSIDRSRLNTVGSSIAVGHPFAATGTRIVSTLAKLLEQKGSSGKGLISVCTAGGMGVAAVLERL